MQLGHIDYLNLDHFLIVNKLPYSLHHQSRLLSVSSRTSHTMSKHHTQLKFPITLPLHEETKELEVPKREKS